MRTKIIILAAGKGTRMKSDKPKVVHKLGGIPLLQHVINNVSGLNPEEIFVVVGHGAKRVKEEIGNTVSYITQTEQKGTGHAVLQVAEYLEEDDYVLISFGDVPLTTVQTFEKLLNLCTDTQIGLLTINKDNPAGYGRVVRNAQSSVIAIVEEKDATDEQRLIKEINTGLLSAKWGVLKNLLSLVDNNNSQSEYYLTDIFHLAVENDLSIETVHPDSASEVVGVNSRLQLAELERELQKGIAKALMENGATLVDPNRLDVRGQLTTGIDVEIDINCVFNGTVELGDGVSIGSNCIISDTVIGNNSIIQANTVIEKAQIGAQSIVGPFARIRPDTYLENNVHIGNFVELKNSHINEGSKVNHLSYIGDSDIGNNTNIGAGTITCNYDGAKKHRTIMGKDVFVGSNSALVAPVKIDDGATIAAGSVIVKDVEQHNLAISRAPQESVKNWKRPQKQKLK